MERQTFNHIRAELRTSVGVYRTAEQIAADTGRSKKTMWRYLNYFISMGEVESQMDDSTGGRPRIEYQNR